jgi:pyruvate,water dikinase
MPVEFDAILFAYHPACRSSAVVGGKAASLASLVMAGFDVPEFCAIRCAAFEQMRHSRSTGLLRPQLSRWIDAQPPGSRFAVRSSGTGEDSAEHSFAGLYSTVLGAADLDSVLDAVLACWDSFDNREARRYRIERQLDAGSMGVVVQRLVDAEWSGVVFGANPVTSALGEYVVNAAPGLGEQLVSGEINPEQIIIEAASAGVVSRSIPSRGASLPESLIRKIHELVRRANAHFRFPQDVEWASVGDRVYALQSRAITTVADVFYSRYLEPWASSAEARPDDPARIWSRAYADEIWAPPVSPLFYNVQNLTPSFAGYWRWHGEEQPLPPDVFKYYKASAYVDVEILRRQYAYHPAFSRIAGILNFFPRSMRKTVSSDAWLWKGRLRRTWRFEFQERALRSLAHNHRKLASLWPGFIKQTNDWFDLDLDQMSLEEIGAHRAELGRIVGIVSPACGFAVAYHAHDLTFVLTGLLERWFGHGDELYARVTSGLDGSVTVDESEQLWRLARLLRAVEADRAGAADEDDFPAMERRSRDTPAVREFLHEFDAFWFEHRHRGASYKDLIHPRWGDDKAQLFALVRSFVASTGRSPRELNAEMAAIRRQTQAELLAVCRGARAWRRPVLRWLFRYNEIYMSERDNHRFYFDRVWYQLRRIYRSYGRRLEAAGVLAAGDDVFFLGSTEVEEALRGELDSAEARARIAVRARVWHATQRQQSPKFLVGYSAYEDGSASVDGEAWIGIGASPGYVTARARVIHDVRDLPSVRDGEVLVTRQTDPAWSTVFARIAGLVLETGGVLAHGASLCREFNLPCVTAVERATEIFTNGDLLAVDGTRGRVALAAAGDREG